VLRPSPENDSGQPIEITVTPRVPTLYHSAVPPRAPMGVPALGVAFQIESEVARVVTGSPAAEASSQLQPGDLLTAAKFIFPKDSKGKTPKPFTIEFGPAEPNWLARFISELFGRDAAAGLGEDEPSWPAAFDLMQSSPAGTQIELTYRRDDKWQTTKLTPVAVDELFAAERGFGLKPIERIRVANSFGEQVRYGWEETADALTMVYRFLAKLWTRQVPLTALGGPVMIAQAAGYSAYEGMAKLLVFLTMLSANLAVINFLPIPLLDGGHMVFLAYEGVRGRPASEKFVVALHMVGFAFIVGLMLFVLALDVNLIPRDL
jgi:regulator of sigma E protease